MLGHKHTLAVSVAQLMTGMAQQQTVTWNAEETVNRFVEAHGQTLYIKLVRNMQF